MKTKMKAALFVLIFAGFLTPGVFAAEGGAKTVSVKLHGGHNMWVLGEIAFGEIGDFVQAGGWSFGGDVLFLDPKRTQLGIEAAYLSVMDFSIGEDIWGEGDVSALEGDISAKVAMIPVTADVVFNSGIFYFDIGLGFAWLVASASAVVNDIELLPGVSGTELLPGYLIKTGIGFNAKLTESFGLDFRASLYLPFWTSDFMSGMDPLASMLAFSQAYFGVGVRYSL